MTNEELYEKLTNFVDEIMQKYIESIEDGTSLAYESAKIEIYKLCEKFYDNEIK